MPVLGIDLVFDIGAAILRVVKASHGKSRDVGCSRRLLCVWECTVVQGQMPTLPRHIRTLSPSVGPSIPAVGGEEGNAAFLLPFFSTERQPGSLQACCFT